MTKLMQGSETPELCAACGRHARGIFGIAYDNKQGIVWVCDDDRCIATATGLRKMKDDRWSHYENRALDKAAKAVAYPILQDMFAALYESGARNLDEVTPEQIDLALDSLYLSGAFAFQIKKALVTFGDSVSADVTSGEPPF